MNLNGDDELNLQLVGAEEHDRIPAIFRVLAAFKEVFSVCTIDALRADRALAQERLRQHLLVANNDRPWLIAAHRDHVHVSGLCIKTEFRHLLLALGRCLLVLVLGNSPC